MSEDDLPAVGARAEQQRPDMPVTKVQPFLEGEEGEEEQLSSLRDKPASCSTDGSSQMFPSNFTDVF